MSWQRVVLLLMVVASIGAGLMHLRATLNAQARSRGWHGARLLLKQQLHDAAEHKSPSALHRGAAAGPRRRLRAAALAMTSGP